MARPSWRGARVWRVRRLAGAGACLSAPHLCGRAVLVWRQCANHRGGCGVVWARWGWWVGGMVHGTARGVRPQKRTSSMRVDLRTPPPANRHMPSHARADVCVSDAAQYLKGVPPSLAEGFGGDHDSPAKSEHNQSVRNTQEAFSRCIARSRRRGERLVAGDASKPTGERVETGRAPTRPHALHRSCLTPPMPYIAHAFHTPCLASLSSCIAIALRR